jgi:hypothetical protein
MHHRRASARQADDGAGDLNSFFRCFGVNLEILDQLKPVRKRALNAGSCTAFGRDEARIAVDVLNQTGERRQEPVVAKIRQSRGGAGAIQQSFNTNHLLCGFVASCAKFLPLAWTKKKEAFCAQSHEITKGILLIVPLPFPLAARKRCSPQGSCPSYSRDPMLAVRSCSDPLRTGRGLAHLPYRAPRLALTCAARPV